METGKDVTAEILDAFKIGVERVGVHVGCATTLFKIKPKPGIKVSKVRNPKDEIAIALDVESVRIIPGKGTVCVEVPNEERKILSVEDILSSEEYKTTDMALPCAIGGPNPSDRHSASANGKACPIRRHSPQMAKGHRGGKCGFSPFGIPHASQPNAVTRL